MLLIAQAVQDLQIVYNNYRLPAVLLDIAGYVVAYKRNIAVKVTLYNAHSRRDHFSIYLLCLLYCKCNIALAYIQAGNGGTDISISCDPRKALACHFKTALFQGKEKHVFASSGHLVCDLMNKRCFT